MKRFQSNATARRRKFAVEALETRVLPSGVSPLPVHKASFVDADGDKVTIRISGHDRFSVELQGGAANGADVDTITIVAGTIGLFDPSSVLTVKVKPGKFGSGSTEIGTITMVDGPG